MDNSSNRFVVVYRQINPLVEIWLDQQTGVNYIYHANMGAGGLTALLDASGKPVVTPPPQINPETEIK